MNLHGETPSKLLEDWLSHLNKESFIEKKNILYWKRVNVTGKKWKCDRIKCKFYRLKSKFHRLKCKLYRFMCKFYRFMCNFTGKIVNFTDSCVNLTKK